MPSCVVAASVIVGEFVGSAVRPTTGSSAFARPKSRTLTVPSGADLDVGRLQVAMDDAAARAPLRARRRSAARSAAAPRATRHAAPRAMTLRQVSPSTSSMTSAQRAAGLLDAVDLRDVRMVQRGERPALRARSAPAARDRAAKSRRQDLDRDVAIEPRVARAIDLAHSAGAEQRDDVVEAEAGAGASVMREDDTSSARRRVPLKEKGDGYYPGHDGRAYAPRNRGRCQSRRRPPSRPPFLSPPPLAPMMASPVTTPRWSAAAKESNRRRGRCGPHNRIYCPSAEWLPGLDHELRAHQAAHLRRRCQEVVGVAYLA